MKLLPGREGDEIAHSEKRDDIAPREVMGWKMKVLLQQTKLQKWRHQMLSVHDINFNNEDLANHDTLNKPCQNLESYRIFSSQSVPSVWSVVTGRNASFYSANS